MTSEKTASDGRNAAGVAPADTAGLETFIDRFGADGFLELERRDGETMVVRTLKPPSNRPAAPDRFTGTRIDSPVGTRIRLEPEDISSVDVVPQADRVDLLPALAEAVRTGATPYVDVIAAIGDIADERPADVAPHFDAIRPLLEHDNEALRGAAASCASKLAHTDPDVIAPSVEALAALLAERVATAYASHALSGVAGHRPSALDPAIDTLVAAITDEELSNSARSNAIAAVGKASDDQPALDSAGLDDVVALLDEDDVKLRNNAAALLSEFAGLHGEHVLPYLGSVADCCRAEDDYTRVNASAIVARVAEDRPVAVREADVDPIGWLEDDHHLVRVNACWTLGHLGDPDTAEALRTAAGDDHEDVRTRAQWALTRLDK